MSLIFENHLGSRFGRWATAGGVVLISAGITVGAVAFFEEPNLPDDRKESSIHYSLVYALATCAGYEEMAEEVATYDQLTDLGENADYNGTLCEGWVPAPPPNPIEASKQGAELTDMVSGPINGCAEWVPLTFPNDEKGHDPACFTDRFRGTARFFHFPNEDLLERTRDWAFGETDLLYGHIYAAYGGFTALPATWKCTAEWDEQLIDTGPIQGNSIESLGIYLHSLADLASHYDCVTHTEAGEFDVLIPTHYGQWGSSYCSFFEHYEELETDSPKLEGQAPLSRTLEACIGDEAMEYLGKDEASDDFDYNFDSIYAELLAWREANPEYFAGHPFPIERDLADTDYVNIIEMVDSMIIGNSGSGGRDNGIYRIEDAKDIASFCVSIQEY